MSTGKRWSCGCYEDGDSIMACDTGWCERDPETPLSLIVDADERMKRLKAASKGDSCQNQTNS